MAGRSGSPTCSVKCWLKMLELGVAANQSNKFIQRNVRLFTGKQVWELLWLVIPLDLHMKERKCYL